MSQPQFDPNEDFRDRASVAHSISASDYSFPRAVERRSASQGAGKSGGAISWLFGEYVSGPLFLAISGAYTYIAPQALTSREAWRTIYRRTAKRTFDIIGSVIALAITLPVFVVVPFLIKLTSRGPVFYTQVRVGMNKRTRSRRAYGCYVGSDRRRRDRRRDDLKGSPFSVIKFRTMIADAEKNTGPVWATKNDARVTPIGRFLRRSRIDELPQIFNVLAGDMSLIGPRPERPLFVRELSSQVADYDRRLSFKPGITGLAQIEVGYDSSVYSVAEKIRADLRYIDTWTLWSDIKIVLRTVKVVSTGHGAH